MTAPWSSTQRARPLLPDRAPAAAAVPSPAVVVPVILLFVAVALLPVLLTRLPPLVDYINHLARMHVIAAGGRDPLLDRFYAIGWKIVPNLAEDLVVPPLARLGNVYLAGKLFVLAYIVLILTGAHAIHYALHRHLSLGPLVAVLFLYNRIDKMGTVNYLFGIGIAMWALAAWIALRQAPPLLRGAVSLAFVIVLFFCHLSALGIYGVAIASYEAWRAWSAPADWRRRLGDAAVLLLPFAAALALLFAGPSSTLPVAPPRWELFSKLRGIYFAINAYSDLVDIPLALAMAGIAVWAVRRGILRVHPAGWFFMAFAAAVFLAMPVELMSAWGADLRLPAAALFILTGFLDWRLNAAGWRIFVAVLAGFAILRLATVEIAWHRFDRVVAEFRDSLRQVVPGSTILVARQAPRVPTWLSPLGFLPCLATVERSSLVSLTFSHPLQQILVVKPPYRAIAGGYDDNAVPIPELLSPPARSAASPSGRIYWADWPRTYDYVYVINTAGEPNPAPDRLDRLYEGEHFQLYRVKHPR